MNIKSLRKHLAIKVMGFKKGERQDEYWQEIGSDVYGLFWKPDKNIEQATQCLDAIVTTKIGWNLYINCSPQKYVCKVHRWSLDGTRKSILGVEADYNKALASSIACAKATGWKDD